MKNFNSQAVRNEVLNMQAEHGQTVNQTVKSKQIDKGVVAFIGTVIAFVIVCVILNHFGLITSY